MAEITFQDYSDVLRPLPAMPSDGSAAIPRTRSTPDTSFRTQLNQFLGEDVASELGPDVPLPLPAESLTGIPVDMSRLTRGILLNGNAGTSTQGISDSDQDRLMEVCKDIEGYMLNILLKDLGKSFASSTLFSQNWESSFYKEMFFSELAQAIGRDGPGLGIADSIYRDIISKEGMTVDQVI